MTETKYKIAIIQGLLTAPLAYLWYMSGFFYDFLPLELLYYTPDVISIPLMALVYSLPMVAWISLIDFVGSGLKTWKHYLILWGVTTVSAIALGFVIFIISFSYGGFY